MCDFPKNVDCGNTDTEVTTPADVTAPTQTPGECKDLKVK